MNQNATIRIKGPNYRINCFFMWVGLASAAVAIIALSRSRWLLAAAGFILLLISRKAGERFDSQGIKIPNGLR